MLFSKFSKWKRDEGRAASLLRGEADSGSHRSFASTRRRSVHRAGSFCKLLFRSARSFEGCPARNRVVFINSGKGCGKRGPLPESRGTAELALCLQVVRCRQVRGAGNSLRGPSADEDLPISGRSPQFFCHGSSQESAACSGERAYRAERHVRLGGHVRRTRCPALRRIRHLHARPCPHKPDSHVRSNTSAHEAKVARKHQGRMDRGGG